MRTGALAVAALVVVGTVAELAITRHWNGFEQLVPWFALAAVTAALVLVAGGWPAGRRPALVLAGMCALAGAYGVLEHVERRHDTLPLDAAYDGKWDAMSTLSQWWAAFTSDAGKIPVLAPGALTVAAALVLVAAAGPGFTVRRRG
jgi:hypothetical protein